jgi:hypothetical protein
MKRIKKFRFDRSIPSNLAVYNSGHNENEKRAVDLLNWAAIAAAILVVGVGTSFWTLVGLMIRQLWK